MKTTKRSTTIQRLGFQRMPASSLFPVRALRIADDTEDPSKDLLLSTRGVGDKATACALVASFLREFPSGKVEIEGDAPDFVLHSATGANINRLFDGRDL